MLRGISVSDGTGIGKAYIIRNAELTYDKKTVTDAEAEKARFHKAVDEFCLKAEALAKKTEETSSAKEAEIIRGHIIMISDPFMVSQIDDKIHAGQCAEAACDEVLNMFHEMFMAADDELTRQRAADVNDIRTRLLSILLGVEERNLADIPPASIIVTEELTPSMTAELNRDNVCGIVTEKGGKTSHSAILARALELPAVLSVPDAVSSITDGMTVIVDGSDGIVIPEPDDDTTGLYAEKQEAFEREKKLLADYAGRPTVTADGLSKEVYCNIGNVSDAVTAVEKSGEGIGLFRTEFLFMESDHAPDEELQFETYKKAAQLFKDGSVIIRTLDVGGDKGIQYLAMQEEANPFLGFRAVRYCLENIELFKTQLRAILRASAFGSIRIMVPLITNVGEIRGVRQMVEELKTELKDAGLAYDENIQIGAMIETPAAAMIADLLAEECDFFSIGTNDLTQYTMAADRGNPQVSYLNNVYEPAVLRSIRHIIECGTKAGIPVGMCGEAAADPMMTPLLIAFGLDEFSVNPASVLKTRYNIARWTKAEADSIAEKTMSLTTASEIEEYLKEAVK